MASRVESIHPSHSFEVKCWCSFDGSFFCCFFLHLIRTVLVQICACWSYEAMELGLDFLSVSWILGIWRWVLFLVGLVVCFFLLFRIWVGSLFCFVSFVCFQLIDPSFSSEKWMMGLLNYGSFFVFGFWNPIKIFSFFSLCCLGWILRAGLSRKWSPIKICHLTVTSVRDLLQFVPQSFPVSEID